MQWDELVQDPVAIAIAAAVVIVIVVVALVVFMMRRRRRRRDMLQRRFGAEYERTVEQGQSRRSAEDDLAERRRRHERMDLRVLTADERDHFFARFEEIQASFVDAPEAAVRSADVLLDEVARTRGYREVGGSSRLAMVSVDHPGEVAAHHRGLAQLDADDQPNTESLRQTLLSTRRLVERLIVEGEAAAPATPSPPPSLLGLHEAEDEHDGDDEATGGDAATGERGRSDRREPGGAEEGRAGERPSREAVPEPPPDRTLSTRPDDAGKVDQTVDLTKDERTTDRR